MAEKRKHDDPTAPDQPGALPSDVGPSSNSPQEGSGTVQNYPRKRIAIAVSLLCYSPLTKRLLMPLVQCLPLPENSLRCSKACESLQDPLIVSLSILKIAVLRLLHGLGHRVYLPPAYSW